MTTQAAAIWRKNLLVWLALMALLGTTFGLAHVPLSPFNGAIGLTISAVKSAFVLLFFMGLRRSRVLMALAGSAGLFWLCLLFALTFADLFTR
jgi:cytochrome c oxidase subunit 4